MDAAEIIQLTRDGIYVLIIIATPTIVVSLIVGLVIALFQALTQIQEATLTFVPKMLAMLLTLVVVMPFMFDQLTDYSNRLYERIVNIE